MEEDNIVYLEKRMKNSRRIFEEVGTHTFLDEEIMTIIEELIEGYKTYRKQLNGAFDRGFIPISVIQNKLEKLKREFDFYAGREHFEWQDGEFDGEVCDDISIKIGVLQELLEERNK